MLSTLLAQFWPYILLAVAALAGAFGLRQSGKSAARAQDAAKINEQAAKARKEARHVADKVDSMGDTSVADKLKSDWVRNDKPGS